VEQTFHCHSSSILSFLDYNNKPHTTVSYSFIRGGKVYRMWTGKVYTEFDPSFLVTKPYQMTPQVRSYHKDPARSCTGYWWVTNRKPCNLPVCFQPWYGVNISGQLLTLLELLLKLESCLDTIRFHCITLDIVLLCVRHWKSQEKQVKQCDGLGSWTWV
jgi:hypothetical protein